VQRKVEDERKQMKAEMELDKVGAVFLRLTNVLLMLIICLYFIMALHFNVT